MTDKRAARQELLRRRQAQRSAATTTTNPPSGPSISPSGPSNSPSGPPISPSGPSNPSTVPAGTLGIAERRMWRIHQLDPDSVSHNITLLLSVTGTTPERIIAGIETTVANASVLGSVIVDDETPRREPAAVTGRWVEPGGLWSLGKGLVGEGITPEQTAAGLARTPFDLTKESPLRARVFAPTADGVPVVLSFHHLAVDDTSWPLLLGSILAGTWTGDDETGEDAPTGIVDPTTLQLAVDFARTRWAADGIRFPLSGELPVTTAEDSWLNPLDEGPGQQLRADLDTDDLTAFTAFAPSIGGTGNAALVVLIALTVTALTGVTDHVLVVPADNRKPGQTPDRVGYCGNIIPIRFSFDPADTVDAAMRAGLASIYAAMSHAEVDFGTILTALRTSGGRFPVMEILGSVRNAPMRGIPVPDGVAVDYRSVSSGIAPYPLSLAIEVTDEADQTRAHLEVDYQLGTGEVIADQAVAVVATLLQRIPTAVDEPLAALIESVFATSTAAT